MNLLLLTSILATSITNANESYTFKYFDEAHKLTIDPTMIMIFDKDEMPTPPNFVQDISSEFSLSAVPGFAYVNTSNVQSIKDTINNLEKSNSYDFVSPVFLSEDGLPYIPTNIIMARTSSLINNNMAEKILEKHGTILESNFSGIQNLYRIETSITNGYDVLKLTNKLSSMDIFEFVESDAISWTRSQYIPNDPEFGQQWGLDQANNHDMDLPEAWDITLGSSEVSVVILDSGIDQNHNDITQLPGQTFSSGSSNGDPSNGCDNHGTAVAGCVSASIDNNLGVVGVAPNCTVRAGKIFNEIDLFSFCLGFLEFQDSWAVSGITWSADIGAKVTNSSWGGGAPSASITTAFNQTRDQGVLHVAAAGNDGTSTLGWPSSLDSVIAVAAMSSNGTLASFSTYGNGLFISAPGQSIRTTDRSDSEGYDSGNTTTIDGTSFASPYVAGVAALIFSVDNSLTPAEVEDILASTAVDYGSTGYDTTFGHGFVNAFNALDSMETVECLGDINDDGDVGITEVLTIIDQWGLIDSNADVTQDGIVDVTDLLIVVGNWGQCE